MGCASSSPDKCAHAEEDVQPKDFHAKYVLGEKLGSGSFAQVRLARTLSNDRKPSEEKAVKIIDLRERNPTEKKKLVAVHREVKYWARVGCHAHCVRLFEVFQSAEMCYIVMEKCKYSLFEHLDRMPCLTERSMGKVISEMLLGIAHLHSVDVVHRDIKPDNFLIGDGHTVKLCDFGLSASAGEAGKLQGIYGTAPFMCPEMLQNLLYDEKADLWSLGVVVYSLLFGCFPYCPQGRGPMAMKMAIIEGIPPRFKQCSTMEAMPAMCTDVAMAFVKALLSRDPEKRPSANEALNMEFVVAAVQDRHANGVELPSLRQMLKAAAKVGAFEVRPQSKQDDDDDDAYGLLNQLQMEMHCVPIHEYEKVDDCLPETLTDVMKSHRKWTDEMQCTPIHEYGIVDDFSLDALTDIRSYRKGSDFDSHRKGSDFDRMASFSTVCGSSSLRSRSGSYSPSISSTASPSRKGTAQSAISL